MYNKHAQNYTKYAQNGAFTNGTPYITSRICIVRTTVKTQRTLLI